MHCIMSRKTITFFMLVTPRDVFIADFSIRSFKKLSQVLRNFNWKLQIYLNCLSEQQKDKYIKKWRQYSYVEILDNSVYVDRNSIKPGELVTFDGISTRPFEGKYEIGCVVWEREFRKISTDYWCLVDADFEILEADFIHYIFDTLESNSNIWVFSTDSGEKCRIYNSYCNEHIISAKRFDTWFCVYKKDCLKCNTPLYYHEEIINSEKWVWDDTGKFQEDLQKQECCRLLSLKDVEPLSKRMQFVYQYIHYGAFSKNISLSTKYNVAIYRFIVIMSHRGMLFMKRDSFLNKIIRKLFSFMYKMKYKQLIKERKQYHFK